MAAAHRRVENLEVQDGLCGVEPAQFRQALRLGPVVALQRRGLVLERREPFFRQGLQRAVHDEINEFLRRVEAAAVLAGVGVGADGYAVVADAHRLALQQAFVDRAQLLHRHVAVVDEMRPAVAHGVDDRGDGGVRQARVFQQWGGFAGKQAAVVRRQADGGVALVDEGEQRRQVVVIAGGVGGERVAVLRSPRDVVAHPLAQAVVVIARVVDGEQSAVLGIQHEQQPVQEDQRGVADFRQGDTLGCRVSTPLLRLGEPGVFLPLPVGESLPRTRSGGRGEGEGSGRGRSPGPETRCRTPRWRGPEPPALHSVAPRPGRLPGRGPAPRLAG